MGKGYGLPYTILRTGSHFGLYTPDDTVMAIFAKNGLSGEPLVIHGDGAQSRDFVNIEDVAQAVLKCTQVGKAAHYEIINIGAGDKHEHNIITLAGIFQALLKNYKRVNIDKGAWRNMKEEKDLRIQLDIAKAKKLLGYSPLMDILYVIRDFIKFVAAYYVGVGEKEMAKIEEAIQMGGADMDRLVRSRDEDLAKHGKVLEDNPYVERMRRYGKTDISEEMLDYEKRTSSLVKKSDLNRRERRALDKKKK
jgi:dTDP-D-glucose 4,6-dehydratase